MRDILQEIVATKQQEIAAAKRITPLELLVESAHDYARPAISMRRSLESSATGIIAEFKRRSPSKGWINESADCSAVVGGYAAVGAAACSVLIDSSYFGGSVENMAIARVAAPQTPLLFKEFIVDPYQLYQARLAGADAVLLIAACLTTELCQRLALLAHELNLEVLLEVHAASELEYVSGDIDMVGVNNRHLGTFHTDINQSFALADDLATLPGKPLLVSESGISATQSVKALRKVGFRGFLMGENFMKSADPAAELETFITQLT